MPDLGDEVNSSNYVAKGITDNSKKYKPRDALPFLFCCTAFYDSIVARFDNRFFAGRAMCAVYEFIFNSSLPDGSEAFLPLFVAVFGGIGSIYYSQHRTNQSAHKRNNQRDQYGNNQK